MKITYTNFQGMRPALDERSLAQLEATKVVDADLRYLSAKPFLVPDPDHMTSARREPLGYLTGGFDDDAGYPVSHLVDILHEEAALDPEDPPQIPKGVYQVRDRGTCVAASAVANDEHERVYFSVPNGGIHDRGRTDGINNFEERPVGVAAPNNTTQTLNTPTVVGRTPSEASFTVAAWRWYVEEIDTGRRIASGGILESDIIESQGVDPVTNNTVYTYEYDLQVSDSSHPFHDYVPTAGNPDTHYFIMYNELKSKESGRFLGTVFPSPSSSKEDTDAYVGGTIADMAMVLDTANDKYHAALTFAPASDEYSHYRSYVFTFITDRGEESAPSLPTEPVPVTPAQKVSINIDLPLPPPNVEHIRLYRTETTDAGTAFFFVVELTLDEAEHPQPPEGYLGRYLDLKLSVDLPGDTLQSRKWETPDPNLKGLVLSTKGFYAAYLGNLLYLSVPRLAYAWPKDYAIEFTGDVKHIARYGDSLAVFTDREIALIVGNSPLEVRKVKVEGFENLSSIYSTSEMDGLLYFATATGLAAIAGANVAMVSDALVSEAFWRDTMDSANVQVEAFDSAVYVLSGVEGQLFRLGLQKEGGGFVELSDANILDIHASSFYEGVMLLPETGEGTPAPAAADARRFYVFNVNSTTMDERKVTWRSRVEVAGIPMSPISVRVLADKYPADLRFRMYNGDDPAYVLEITPTDDRVRKMPVLRREREWSFEIEGTANMLSIEVGTSGRAN